ncbi:MAG: sulfurtransferase TusA family protein [Thermoleophilaceae bacterium]
MNDAALLDLRGVLCPLNWVRARLALEGLEPGQSITLRLDPGEPVQSVPRSAREEGHAVSESGTTVTIVKR